MIIPPFNHRLTLVLRILFLGFCLNKSERLSKKEPLIQTEEQLKNISPSDVSGYPKLFSNNSCYYAVILTVPCGTLHSMPRKGSGPRGRRARRSGFTNYRLLRLCRVNASAVPTRPAAFRRIHLSYRFLSSEDQVEAKADCVGSPLVLMYSVMNECHNRQSWKLLSRG